MCMPIARKHLIFPDNIIYLQCVLIFCTRVLVDWRVFGCYRSLLDMVLLQKCLVSMFINYLSYMILYFLIVSFRSVDIENHEVKLPEYML